MSGIYVSIPPRREAMLRCWRVEGDTKLRHRYVLSQGAFFFCEEMREFVRKGYDVDAGTGR